MTTNVKGKFLCVNSGTFKDERTGAERPYNSALILCEHNGLFNVEKVSLRSDVDSFKNLKFGQEVDFTVDVRVFNNKVSLSFGA